MNTVNHGPFILQDNRLLIMAVVLNRVRRFGILRIIGSTQSPQSSLNTGLPQNCLDIGHVEQEFGLSKQKEMAELLSC